MNILVCVKQVPDVEQITVTEDRDGSAVLGEFAGFHMNRYDEFAVEAAVRLKEATDTVRVDALAVGPEPARDVVKRAIGMGADRGVHLQTADGKDTGPAAVADRIARYAGQKPYALILFGSMSEDGMHGQVGPMTSACLERPCATQVIALKIADDETAVSVEREVEGGARERVHLKLPAVLSLQPGINRPRYPSLSNLLRASRQKMEIISADGLGRVCDPVAYAGAMLPPRTRAGTVLEGTLQEKAGRFITILREKAFLVG